MTTSGSNTFSQNRNQIINLAMAAIGVKTQGRVLTAAEINEASDVLNTMVKSWKNRGDYLWKTTEGTLFVANGQASYALDGSTANATESYNATTISASALSGATSVVVTSATGFVIGYNIGIKQDNNTIHWTTVSSVAGTVIGLTAALTNDAASGNAAYVYQTKITRPELVNSARSRSGTNDIPMTILSRDSYFALPVKDTVGRPNQFYYDKQLTGGALYLWPVPNDVSYTIKFTFQKMFYDFNTGTNTPDFPVEWIRALYLNLAFDLARIYGKDRDFREQLKRDADEALLDCQAFDRENTSVYFQPATQINIGTYR